MKTASINLQPQKTYRRVPSVPVHKPIFFRLMPFISKFKLKRKSPLGVAIHDYQLVKNGARSGQQWFLDNTDTSDVSPDPIAVSGQRTGEPRAGEYWLPNASVSVDIFKSNYQFLWRVLTL
jgi:hypothetical protein